MESQRMGIAAAHDGGLNRLRTHAPRMRRRTENAGYSANSKGSTSSRRSAESGGAGPLQAHLLRSSKGATQSIDVVPKPTAHDANDSGPSETWALFAHADKTDYWLMAGGILASVVSGASLPSINIVFGACVYVWPISAQWIDSVVKTIATHRLEPLPCCQPPPSAANAVTALANSDFPDTNGVDMDSITSCALTLLGIGVWVLVAESVSVALLTHSAARQTKVMRAAALEALMFQDMMFFDGNNPFSLATDIGGNMVVVQDGLGRKLGQFAKHTTQVVLGVTVGIARAWNVGLGLAATVPLFLVAIYSFVSRVSKSTHLEADEYSHAGAVAEEALSAVGTVLAFNAQPGMTARFDRFLVAGDKEYRRFAKIIASAIAFIQFASFVLFGYGLWLGGHFVANQNDVVPTMKDALPAVMVEIAGLLAIGSAAPALEALASARTAAVAVLELDKQRPAIDCRARGRELDIVHGRVAFTDVVFAYPTRARELALKSCSFEIAAGQRVALVGPSGGGKSTLFNLIERLYDPAFGRVLLDGVNVRDLGVRWLRAQLGVVRQEPVLFATTVMENIRYGRPDASDEDVVAAAQRAHAHAFISALPDGYATNIGANGAMLAAGQRQRLAIARAFVKNPAVLLLDEATAALDVDGADAVQHAFDELYASAHITTLVIAHRLATIASADVVFVVEDGKVAERGPYATLAGDPRSRYSMLFGGDRDGDKDAEQTRLTQTHRLSYASSRFRGGDAFRASSIRPSSIRPSSIRPSYLNESVGPVPSSRRQRQRYDSGFVDSARAMDIGFFVVKDSIASSRASDMAWLETTRSTVGIFNEKGEKVQPSASPPSPNDNTTPDGVTATATPADPGLGRKILALMAVDKRFLLLAMGASLVNGIVNPLTAILKSNIVNDMYAIEAREDYDDLRSTADRYFAIFLGAGACLGVSYFVQSYNFRRLGRNLTNRLRAQTFASMLKQDMKWFDEPAHTSGTLSSMLSNDTAAVKIIAGEIQGRKVQNIIVMAFATVLAFAVGSWQATLVFLGVVPFIVATIALDQRITWYAEAEGDRSLATAGRLANEMVRNVETITEHNLQERVLAEYKRALELPTRVAIKTGYSTGFALGFSQFAKWVGYAALHYCGALFIRSGDTTFALFYRTLNLMNVAALCLDETATFLGDEKVARVAASRIFALMEHTPDVDLDAPGEKLPDNFPGSIDVAGVHFAYPLYPDAPVLSDFSMRVRAGETTVLRGGSDAGKSTLLQLLLRLYDTTDGRIAVSGTPIERLDVRWWRSTVAVVHQEPTLFRLSVLDNLRLGCPSADANDVIAVCQSVDAHAFILALPDGYDTLVDTDKFSRGQKQRIALARALLLRPRVLLLDDATSALDNDSRAVVRATLRRWTTEHACTILTVDSSDEGARIADRVVVAANGAVVESGSHDELLRLPGGVYAAAQKRLSSPMTEL